VVATVFQVKSPAVCPEKPLDSVPLSLDSVTESIDSLPFPVDSLVFPLGKIVFPLRKLLFPLGNVFFPLGFLPFPVGSGTESTGFVSLFSHFSRNPATLGGFSEPVAG
jgi:hypothetical protein